MRPPTHLGFRIQRQHCMSTQLDHASRDLHVMLPQLHELSIVIFQVNSVIHAVDPDQVDHMSMRPMGARILSNDRQSAGRTQHVDGADNHAVGASNRHI
jgi:hypothetical protein